MKNSKRIISFLLVIAFLSAPLAQTAYAGSDYGASTWATHYLGVAAQVAAAVIISRITNRVIAKVKGGGPDGGPAFIQNWINFTTQSQYQGEGVFRAMLGNHTSLCRYFGDDLKDLFGARAKRLTGQNTRVGNLDPFALRTKCTLPSSFDMEKYQEDFAGNGGWEAWNRLLEPQNNFYGTLFQSLDEVSEQRALAEKSNTNKAVAGKGYFGFGEKDCRVRVGNNCLVPGNIKTPPATVGDAVANSFNSPTTYLSGSKSDIIATTAISALTTFVINRLFDMAGNSSEPDDSSAADDFSIPSPQRTADSYKQEFCMAEDNMSPDAGNWVKANYPQAWSSFTVEKPLCLGSLGLFGYQDDGCGKSYCERVRDRYDKNEYPYSRCTETCMAAVKGPPAVGLPPGQFDPDPVAPPPGGGGEGEPAPDDAAAKHGNHTSEVAEAKQELIDEGKVFPDPNATDECYRFEIVERAVPKIAGAGFLDKPGGNNCRGFAVDIIAFDDGYIYDVLVGSGDGSMPAWQPVGCGPVGGGGTCPERYRSP